MTAIVLYAAAQSGRSGAPSSLASVDSMGRLPSQVYPQVLPELLAIPKSQLLNINVAHSVHCSLRTMPLSKGDAR